MMRAIFGSAAGGAVAGAIALAASAAHAPRAVEPAWPQATGATGSAYADADRQHTRAAVGVHQRTDARGLRARSASGVAAVDCRQSRGGASGVRDRTTERADVGLRGAGRLLRYSSRLSPARHRPAASRADGGGRRARRGSRAPQREVEPKRSWKKTALIIGGSTGAGAGVGAIAGGKKGALIGAAIGGGAASIYEAMKRK